VLSILLKASQYINIKRAFFAMAMVGGIANTYVRATTPIVLAQEGGQAIKLQPVLD
jgi:PTS system mannose/fructose/sorbose family IID component.